MLLLEHTPWDPSCRTRWTLRTVCCSRKEGCRFSYIVGMQHYLDASSRWDIAPPHSEAVLHCTTRTVGGRSLPPSGLLQGWTFFSENTGLVVGRTLVDPSGWKVPLLVSNFGQETVMVEPFSEIGMIAQVSAIQPTMDKLPHPSCDPLTLPEHLQGLLERASSDLDNLQKSQLANTLLEFVDLFPIPGSALTGYMDAVEIPLIPVTACLSEAYVSPED